MHIHEAGALRLRGGSGDDAAASREPARVRLHFWIGRKLDRNIKTQASSSILFPFGLISC